MGITPPGPDVRPIRFLNSRPRQSSRTRDLAGALQAEVRGEVRFDVGTRAAYCVDSSNYRQVPIGVVLPRDADDVAGALRVCREHEVPILARGGGTSLAGQCCNVAVVFDFSKYMNRIVSIDPERRVAFVEPGVVLDRLQEAARPYGLAFGPDPATHAVCTVGGMIGNDACGVHSLVAGRTSQSVEELEVLTYRGTSTRLTAGGDGLPQELRDRLLGFRDGVADLVRARYPRISRRVSGYSLDELLPERGFHVARSLVGSEGTCAVLLGALLRLAPLPGSRSLVVAGYPEICGAADVVPLVLEHGPIGLEGLDGAIVEKIPRGGRAAAPSLLPDGHAWLLVEFGGDTDEEASERARALVAALGRLPDAPSTRLVADPAEQRRIWEVRESAVGLSARGPDGPDRFGGWEDAAVPPERLGDYLRDFTSLLGRFGRTGVLYGHFGEGCVHTRIDFDLASAPGISAYRRFVEEAADLVVSYGGSLSGEHGDGQARAELLPRMFGEELVAAFREFKAIWDPDGKLNPGKIVDPLRLDEQLRLGAGFAPARPRTHFPFADDDGSFGRAVLRCVGAGKCRKTHTGTMCPSYMVTRDESYSTRGRARLLFEMLQGDPLRGGWHDRHVREALDLCLSCKGCKSECPAGVDMAAYKAEFLSHYYARRPRPPEMVAVGLIFRWARVASRAPRLANGLARSAKTAIGIAPERRLPAFAPETFRAWFARRPPARDSAGERVLLWPDTFTNYFAPERGRAAVTALEAAGLRVEIPRRLLCCGRPLYDCGMLPTAKRQLRSIVSELRDEIRAGTTVVGLEPSCTAVFRDELPALFPDDEDSLRLSTQTLTLAELLGGREWQPPHLDGSAIVHGHCHQKAVWSMDADVALLAALGLEVELLDSGCCGMAGGFGFRRDKLDLSIACGERVLLPAVRAAPAGTFLVADGFSCREQVEQTTGKRCLHTAEVVARALDRTVHDLGRVPATETNSPFDARPLRRAQGGV
jgi:FAD/FMN-containing dehydrogenase/Fe-S oxidoreductase